MRGMPQGCKAIVCPFFMYHSAIWNMYGAGADFDNKELSKLNLLNVEPTVTELRARRRTVGCPRRGSGHCFRRLRCLPFRPLIVVFLRECGSQAQQILQSVVPEGRAEAKQDCAQDNAQDRRMRTGPAPVSLPFLEIRGHGHKIGAGKLLESLAALIARDLIPNMLLLVQLDGLLHHAGA